MTREESQALLARLVRGELPDARGRFGPFGGRYAPETLVPALERLTDGARRYLKDPDYTAELGSELREWVGRPTPLTPARHLGRESAKTWPTPAPTRSTTRSARRCSRGGSAPAA
jgi:tryptophan synthase beta chain